MKALPFTLVAMLCVSCSEERVSLRTICETNPQFCSDLNEDSRCKESRREVIIQRFEESKLPSEATQYQLIRAFENYSSCIELASGIEHIQLKEKTTSRVKGYLTSLAEIKRLSEANLHSDNPHWLYYHWSRNRSESHLEKFLLAEQKGELETPELQVSLASYYSKFNRKKSLHLLHHALELSQPNHAINPDIYASLASAYFKTKEYGASYHWAYLAKLSGAYNVELKTFEVHLEMANLDTKKLTTLAKQTLRKIEQGFYKQDELIF